MEEFSKVFDRVYSNKIDFNLFGLHFEKYSGPVANICRVCMENLLELGMKIFKIKEFYSF
jgi:hypothetical protein